MNIAYIRFNVGSVSLKGILVKYRLKTEDARNAGLVVLLVHSFLPSLIFQSSAFLPFFIHIKRITTPKLV